MKNAVRYTKKNLFMNLKLIRQNILIVCSTLFMAVTLSCNSPSNKNTESILSKIDSIKLNYKTGVRSILEDSKGNVWFGSYSEGVCLLQNGKLQYFSSQNGLSDNQVRNIYEDKNGTIWFECGIGLSIYDGEKMAVHGERKYDSTKKLKLSDHDLWFKSDGSMGSKKFEKKSGVYQYDGKDFYYHTFTVKDKSGHEIPWSKSTDFVRSKNGAIWFGAYSELIGYDGKKLITYNNESVGLNGTTENLHIRSLMEDSKGNLWIGNNCGGGRSGIGVIKFDGKNFIPFTKQHQLRKEDTNGNSLDKVFSMCEDSFGNIWFGTNESGVWRYDGHTLKNYIQENGLDSGIIWVIYKSKSGELWFGGGPNGVYRFTGKSFKRIF
jgi:ligand-binding sensor domain-containing protein